MTADLSREWRVLPEDKAEEIVYARIHEEELRLIVMRPEGKQKNRPAIIFIHGGGFCGGVAETFLPQFRRFVQLGFVCITVNYRLMKCNGNVIAEDSVALYECVADCKTAVRYVRKNAEDLGVDPQKIILMGESAGGYLASAVTTLRDFDSQTGVQEASCVPDVLILYNPITHLLGNWKMRVPHEPLPGETAVSDDIVSQWVARHERARELSPLCQLTAQHPTVLLVHGLADTVVPPEHSVEYVHKLWKLGVKAELELLPESKHAFALYNYTATDQEVLYTIQVTEDFLKRNMP